jgi:hypothetical protein
VHPVVDAGDIVTVIPGWLIVTSSVKPGTRPVLQLEAVSHSPLDLLIQLTPASKIRPSMASSCGR